MASNGKTAIITGANRGIGLATFKKLNSNGYNVAVCVRSLSADVEKIVEAPEFNGQEHRIFNIDLTDKSSIYDCVKSILSWSKTVDVLVNNAGMAHGSLFLMTPIEDLRQVFEMNFLSQIYLTQLVSKRMLRAKSGVIINMASTAGLLADVGTLAYGCSKAALIHGTKIMASELGRSGIRVNCIAPSVAETDMGKLMDEKSIALLDQRSALSGRIKPDEISDLVLFLISDGAKNISGQVIRIDQGMPF
ncbi:SDR family NAD(P)-dependent oxidoreductase [Pseudopelagicola sp. nBUS_20]|uniref:SDR family NAD(P)-dependent oxidoreductase n=1 Tax=Pseudopelagicola sp. nBUS_20 TaxID=3395317 RepID=UPI003EBDCB2D